jgi:hypothetical protein
MPYRIAASSDTPSVIGDVLRDKELVLWWAQPKRSPRLTMKRDWYLIPRALTWIVFSCFWVTVAVSTHASPLTLVGGLALVLFGIYTTVGWYVKESAKRAHTWYAITSERALIITTTRAERRTESIELAANTTSNIVETPAGHGSISFGTATIQPDIGWLPITPVATFDNVADVRSVASIVREAQRGLESHQTHRTSSTLDQDDDLKREVDANKRIKGDEAS